MTSTRTFAGSHAGRSAPGRARALSAADAAWLAAVPTAAIAIGAMLLLAPTVGRTLLAPTHARFWVTFAIGVRPKPVEQARFLFAVGAPLLLAALAAAALRAHVRMRPAASDALVVATQVLLLAFGVVCVLEQRELFWRLYTPDILLPPVTHYFTVRTLLVAAVGTPVVVLALGSARVRERAMSLIRETRRRKLAAGAIAIVAIVVWLLHAIYTEATIGASAEMVLDHVNFTLDETFAVLNGRSPLVNFAAQYGSLWPYAFAAAMWVLGASVGVWSGTAVAVTGLAMLAIYAVLRRAARSATLGLLLFLPVLATSFFMIGGTHKARYTFGDYYGTFPMRYAGPAFVAWLVARHLDELRPRRVWPLFLAAGLVVLNNFDAGVPAVGAALAALLWSGGLGRRELVRLAREMAIGLGIAYCLVATLTLARAGALPDLGLLLRFTRLFASSGFGMYATPTIGLHVAIYLTFAAALGVATVRALRAEPDRALTGMLAWSGVFGLGAGAYFMGRSTPDDLAAIFFPWSFSLALLMVPALRSLAGMSWRRPPLSAAACIAGFLLCACSLAQTPTPWEQLDRLRQRGPPVLAAPAGQTLVARNTHRGEPVAILLLLGHRIGANLGVSDISPYTNSLSMPTVEQFEETIRTLYLAGGNKIFLRPSFTTEDMESVLRSVGFRQEAVESREDAALWVLERR